MSQRLNIVLAGHVDHGKSTIVGRLLADSGALPDGKLAQVKAYCERNATKNVTRGRNKIGLLGDSA